MIARSSTPVAERLRDHWHPRLVALRDAPGSEAAFWEAVAVERTPLVEPDPDHPGHSRVTYVFAAPEGTGHVVVQTGLAGSEHNLMQRIPGANVWFASYRYRDDVRSTYSFAPDMPLVRWEEADEADLAALASYSREHPPSSDPHAREDFLIRMGGQVPDRLTSMLTLPGAPANSRVGWRKDAVRGKVETHSFESTILGNTRRVFVQTPAGYDPSAAYPLLVAFDGGAALAQQGLRHLLDNLIAEGAMRPHIAVFIDNATDTSRGDELPCNDAFVRMFEIELLPWLQSLHRLAPADPDGPGPHTVTGCSYGGLASLWFAWRMPHLFGTVIAQAPSLWWGPGYINNRPWKLQSHTPEWLIDQFAAGPRLPVRVWQEIGLMEAPATMLEPNRRMREVLEAKGNDLTYREFAGGHDYGVWRYSIAEALTTMLPPTFRTMTKD